jgi:2,4-dienoyl-CoA reductase-like NADH-dependent reductase (Old Yellow Enzyme family)
MPLSIEPLFTPLQIGQLTLRNRLVMAPMTREFSPNGTPGQDVTDYYGRRATDAGLIVTEGVGIPHPASVDNPAMPLIYGDDALAGWRRTVEAVHAAGGLIFPQLWHQGIQRNARIAVRPDVIGVRPSGIWGPEGGTVSLEPEMVEYLRPPTRPMTESEIQEVIDAYAQGAANAATVGFDGIAIHGAHGYLIDSFLWKHTNLRTDRWGGDHVQRTRFVVEVVKAIRASVGAELPIMLRFSQFKMQDYRAQLATNPQELEEILGPIADAGVDIFDASTRYFDIPAFEGSTLNLAGWAKKITGKPTMTVGGVGLNKGFGASMDKRTDSDSVNNFDPLMNRFNAGEFDLIGVGRSLLNDPEWIRKARAGHAFDVFDPKNLRRLT